MKTKLILKKVYPSSGIIWEKCILFFILLMGTLAPLYGQTKQIYAEARPIAPQTLTISGETNPCPNISYRYELKNVPATPSGYYGPYFDWSITNGSGGSVAPICYVIWEDKPSGSIKGTVTFTKAGSPNLVYEASLNVVIKKLGTLGQISGPTVVPCGSTTPVNYSVPLVGNANSYQWTFPSGWTFAPSSCTNCNQISLIPPASCKSGWICVVAQNTGCGTQTPSSCIYVTNENPVPVLNSPILHICTNVPHDYPYSITALSGATGYLWTVSGAGASITGSNTGTSVTLHTDANVNGTVTLTVTAYFPYNKTSQTTITINLTNLPPATPQVTGNKYLECVYHNDVYLSVANAAPYTSYTWSWTGPSGGIKLVGSVGPSTNVIANRVGSYNVYARASNVCGTSPLSLYYPIDVIECSRANMTDDVPKINAASDVKELSFYPNPASNSFELILPAKGNAHVKLISLHGQVIKQFNVADQQTTLNISDVASGLYILCISMNGETMNKRIEVTR